MRIFIGDVGEKLIIDYKGSPIELHLFSLSNDQVKFGIQAPSGISIHREEIYNLIQTKNKENQR